MVVEITQLVDPTELTTGLALIIISLLAIFGYMGIRLRHPGIILFLSLTVIVFMLVILINLSFIWFWIMIIVTAMVTALGGIYRYLSI